MSAAFRYMAVIKVKPDVTPTMLDQQLIELDAIMARGPLPYRLERDLKLQPATADYALVIDFRSQDELAEWNAPSLEHAAMKSLAGETAQSVMVMAHKL